MNQSSPIGVSNLLQQIISPGDVVLDLGSFESGTTRAFLKKRCRCYVEDLPDFIEQLDVKDDHKVKDKLKSHLMILQDRVKVDVILTWDLFHYLDLNAISSLFELLNSKMKNNTIVHSTRLTNSFIPKKPQRFKLLDDFSFDVVEKKTEVARDNKIPNNSHTTIDLLKRLQHFNLYDTLTHKNKAKKGLFEYALCYGKSPRSALNQETYNSSPIKKTVDILPEKEFNHIDLPNLKKQLAGYRQSKANYIIDCSGSFISNKLVVNKLTNHFFEENIYNFMAWQQQISVGQEFVISDQILKYHTSVKFDLVMLWDLISFWQPNETESLIKKLVQHMEPHGLLHLVMPSRYVAKKPANYRITEDLNIKFNVELTDNNLNNNLNNRNILSTNELIRLLPNFKVLSYYFGTRNSGENYQEYLFEYQGA